MPEFQPVGVSNTMAAIGEVVKLSPGSAFFVREKRMKRNTPWYLVGAIEASNGDRFEGWINSTALLGQEIEKVE